MIEQPPTSRSRAKLFLRRLAIGMCELLLRASSKPLPLKEGLTVVIAPHQDDEALGCGGVIARKRNEGLPVHVIFLTDGAASHPDHPRVLPSELSSLRNEEALRALFHLGVERSAIHFLDEPDGTLPDLDPPRRLALLGRLAALLDDLRPVELFLPCSPDGSSEHDAAFTLVLESLDQARLAPEIWQYPVWSWWNPGLMFRRWLDGRHSRQLPLEDYRHAKLKAIACYRTQIFPLAPDPHPSLPASLVEVFRGDTEFYFHYPRRNP